MVIRFDVRLEYRFSSSQFRSTQPTGYHRQVVVSNQGKIRRNTRAKHLTEVGEVHLEVPVRLGDLVWEETKSVPCITFRTYRFWTRFVVTA